MSNQPNEMSATGNLDTVSPRWDFMPGWVANLFSDAAGTAMMIGIFACLMAFIVAAITLAFARSQGYAGMGSQAQQKILMVALAAILIGGAVSIVTFFVRISG